MIISSLFGQVLLAVACASFFGSAGAMMAIHNSRYAVSSYRAYQLALGTGALSFVALVAALFAG